VDFRAHQIERANLRVELPVDATAIRRFAGHGYTIDSSFVGFISAPLRFPGVSVLLSQGLLKPDDIYSRNNHELLSLRK
jgi:hypothetical protein